MLAKQALALSATISASSVASPVRGRRDTAGTAGAASLAASAQHKGGSGSSSSHHAGSTHAGTGLPWVYTFRASTGFTEDAIVRHIEPPSSAALELHRLSNFRIRLVPTPNRVVHVYAAEPRTAAAAAGGSGEGSSGSGAQVRDVLCWAAS
jgi:hypothetical protein